MGSIATLLFPIYLFEVIRNAIDLAGGFFYGLLRAIGRNLRLPRGVGRVLCGSLRSLRLDLRLGCFCLGLLSLSLGSAAC
jgi:hypothetical protein